MRLKARHWGGATFIAIALAIAGWLIGNQRMTIPFMLERVPLRALLPGIAAMVSTYPLLDWYPGFSDLLVREPRLRPWRVVAATALFAVATLPGTAADATGTSLRAEFVLALGFLALGLATVVLVGDLSWLAVLTATFAVLFLNTPPVEQLTHVASEPRALVIVLGSYLGSAVAYIYRGPRRRRLPL